MEHSLISVPSRSREREKRKGPGRIRGNLCMNLSFYKATGFIRTNMAWRSSTAWSWTPLMSSTAKPILGENNTENHQNRSYSQPNAGFENIYPEASALIYQVFHLSWFCPIDDVKLSFTKVDHHILKATRYLWYDVIFIFTHFTIVNINVAR